MSLSVILESIRSHMTIKRTILILALLFLHETNKPEFYVVLLFLLITLLKKVIIKRIGRRSK